jgi:cell division protein FtsL
LKVWIEANVEKKKLFAILLTVIILLSASTVYLFNQNQKLNSKLENLALAYQDLNVTLQNLESRYNETVSQLAVLDSTVTLERKFWGIVAYNITLKPRDTLAVSIRLNSANEMGGIDGVDRLELTWVGLYSPNLGSEQTTSARVIQYFGGDHSDERWIGEKVIGFGGPQRMIMVPKPISNDTVVRESVNSASFFFENYNYLGYNRPGSYITLKMFYDGNVPVIIRELELYVVGFIKVKVGETPALDSGWICHDVKWEVRHWGEMT